MAKTTTTAPKKTTKQKVYTQIETISLSVLATFNNTLITANESATGKVLDWTSAGRVGFKGAKKGTPYAATTAMKSLIERLQKFQPKMFKVQVSGAGNGRDAALRAIIGSNVKVTTVKDITPMPHNGCRPKKARKV